MSLAAIVLAAGLGTRMKSQLPKVLHPLAGRPMLAHLLDNLARLAPQRVAMVIGPGQESVAKVAAPHPCVIQADRLGTAHAALQARPLIDGFQGDVLILFGDTPLVTSRTMEKLVLRRREKDDPAVVVLGFRPSDPAGYGRLVMGDEGLLRIVEVKDASASERAIPWCNSGVMAIDGKILFDLLSKIDNKNAKGEYYLTDLVSLAREAGRICAMVEGSPEELLGINSRAELAQAEAIVQNHMRANAMENGATLIGQETIFFSWDTKLGRDVVVGPNVVFGPGVAVGDAVEIRPFSHLEGCKIASGATVGPFARLRPGADIGQNAHIGNFVEIKKAVVEDGAKVNHLTYIGDARVGAKANVGAGTITCNYDGFGKYHTDIGQNAFIGSNSALVAPVKIGDGAIVGAGSVVTQDVPAGALAVARGRQSVIPGWAESFRAAKTQKKDA
ncbi:MAG: bifunctional UDP-N-acetylglucosamine diphosphorylase/glucosamine-1-phosphate N-acetyltransferase GlmU [Alphaproteobacteria bacterium]|nr:bifunctional UDP-N-acetylglucosamine diphosphorylase/glucosamine-1-phosphate N-acetyltransferase GlmU [Alphaproteobacteria bacterium]